MTNKNHKYYVFLFFWVTLTLLFGNIQAQITIKFPNERSVFQRNNQNIGSIQITGNLTADADKVEARLIPRAVTQGTQTDWITIDNQIDGQSFTGFIDGKGGWYSVEIRSILNNQIIQTAIIERVGIGEVFIIAGQSNAQGDGSNPNANGANDDRVNSYAPNYFNHLTALIDFFPEIMGLSQFNQISKNTYVGPLGYTSWCWGDLGDRLAAKLNVPIMFYNTALSGTSTKNWVESIDGIDTYHLLTGMKFERFYPYIALRRTLQNTIKTFGVRAILWHQGEFEYPYTEAIQIANLKKIIQESRNNTNEKIPWVICRASRLGGQNNSNTINAQNNVIASTEMTFAGPATDNIQPDRPDGAHFQNNSSSQGLTLLAEAWNLSLSSQFFSTSTPVINKSFNEINYNCIDQNNVGLKLDNSFNSYLWSNNNTNSTIQANSGEYSVITRDNVGNYFHSNKLNVKSVYPTVKPTVSPVISLVGCIGKTLELSATTSKYPVNWNNGFIGNKLTTGQTSTFFANYRSNQGCLSERSNEVTTRFILAPTKPTIEIINGDGFVCQGEKITFKVNNPLNYEIEWSNGLNTSTILLSNNLTTPLTAKLLSNYDCPSPSSDPPNYLFLEVPATPKILQTGPFSLGVDSIKANLKYEWLFDNKILLNVENSEISITENGFYAVKAIKSFVTNTNRTLVCKSGISTQLSFSKNFKLFGISVYPNPIIDGRFKIASEKELRNVKVSIINSIGQVLSESTLDKLSLPKEFNLNTLQFSGKNFLKIDYEGFSRTFPLILE